MGAVGGRRRLRHSSTDVIELSETEQRQKLQWANSLSIMVESQSSLAGVHWNLSMVLITGAS